MLSNVLEDFIAEARLLPDLVALAVEDVVLGDVGEPVSPAKLKASLLEELDFAKL